MTPAFLSLILSGALSAQSPAPAPQWNARLTHIEGIVIVYPLGREEGAFPAEAETPLEPGDRIETRPGGRVEIALEADSLIALGPNSSFVLEAPREETWDILLEIGTIV